MKALLTAISTALLVFASCKPVQPTSANTRASRQGDSAATSGKPITMSVTMDGATMECRLSNSTKAKVLVDLKQNPPLPASGTFNAPTNAPREEILLCTKEWEEWLLQTLGSQKFAPLDIAGFAVPGLPEINLALNGATALAGACGRPLDAAIGGGMSMLLSYAEQKGWVCKR
jgi:hypothetical protein